VKVDSNIGVLSQLLATCNFAHKLEEWPHINLSLVGSAKRSELRGRNPASVTITQILFKYELGRIFDDCIYVLNEYNKHDLT
jgi:hypothetical protein